MQRKKGQLIELYRKIVCRVGKDIKQQVHQETIRANWISNFEKNEETLMLVKGGTSWVSKQLKRVV